MSSSAIYLDHAATTPLRAEVFEAMRPHLTGQFGNPSSAHRWGRAARAALDEARGTCAEVLGVSPTEILFVRGGTEADNLAVLGRAGTVLGQGERPRAVGTTIEHPAVRDAILRVRELGGEGELVDVGPDGTPDWAALDRALEGGAAVLSVMWVNNEVGTVLPVPEIAERARQAGVVTHSDAVQAVGKLSVDLPGSGLDLLSVTGHKIGGPQGAGLLYRRTGVELSPLLYGGGQEQRVRPGTEDVAGAVGLATALSLAVSDQPAEGARLESERNRLQDLILGELPDTRVHGVEGRRAPHILNVGFAGLEAQTLIMALDLEGVAVSGGSACSSGSSQTSPILRALYGSEAEGRAPVRFSLGRSTTAQDVTQAAEITIRVVDRIRATTAAAR